MELNARPDEEGLGPKPAGKLRSGWTTGTCAAGAAKADLIRQLTGVAPKVVEVTLPSSTKVVFDVSQDELGRCYVVKDAGDDPDCTHGAHITACVEVLDYPGDITILGGPGVGLVTKPGLGLEVGSPAINPVPQKMIRQAIAEVTNQAVSVTITVPGGEEMAKKTTNARLGILGGISILGTTGVVKPFSTSSFRASVVQQIDVAAAQGSREIVFVTGSRSEEFALRNYPRLTETEVVEVGDFSGVAIKRANKNRLLTVHWIGMVGKVSKLAEGTTMTHFHRSNLDTSVLERAARETGADNRIIESAHQTTTARHFYEVCEAMDDMKPLGVLTLWAAQTLSAQLSCDSTIDVTLVDFDATKAISTSPTLAGQIEN
ncbi:MAG: cobalt-precorrin-5B (C(1))-methyltransferase [Acidimicrobiaceae bacterium]|nr:cobalt-precorrin-5B (C(1))-methyltransferase [Acidimicrobiaceae bacterium]